MGSLDLKEFRSSLDKFKDMAELPSENEIIKIADGAINALENELPDYRPKAYKKTPTETRVVCLSRKSHLTTSNILRNFLKIPQKHIDKFHPLC